MFKCKLFQQSDYLWDLWGWQVCLSVEQEATSCILSPSTCCLLWVRAWEMRVMPLRTKRSWDDRADLLIKKHFSVRLCTTRSVFMIADGKKLSDFNFVYSTGTVVGNLSPQLTDWQVASRAHCTVSWVRPTPFLGATGDRTRAKSQPWEWERTLVTRL